MYAVLKLMINMFIQILETEFYFNKNNKTNPYPITVTVWTRFFLFNWEESITGGNLFKVGLSPSEKICVIYLTESNLKMMKNAFCLKSSFIS